MLSMRSSVYLGETEFLVKCFIRCIVDPTIINMGTAVNALCEDIIQERFKKAQLIKELKTLIMKMFRTTFSPTSPPGSTTWVWTAPLTCSGSRQLSSQKDWERWKTQSSSQCECFLPGCWDQPRKPKEYKRCKCWFGGPRFHSLGSWGCHPYTYSNIWKVWF